MCHYNVMLTYVFPQQLELMYGPQQAAEDGLCPQPPNLKQQLSGLVARNLCRCQKQTPPDHIDSTSSELPQGQQFLKLNKNVGNYVCHILLTIT
jgi:hypothetical protein